mmetsp:Transcript_53596/g.160431  ORF Transcript_53596/g.160431 Transcript_53596/m.160431 type:complete len:147 (-) Transcript_53596:44-484(-)
MVVTNLVEKTFWSKRRTRDVFPQEESPTIRRRTMYAPLAPIWRGRGGGLAAAAPPCPGGDEPFWAMLQGTARICSGVTTVYLRRGLNLAVGSCGGDCDGGGGGGGTIVTRSAGGNTLFLLASGCPRDLHLHPHRLRLVLVPAVLRW